MSIVDALEPPERDVLTENAPMVDNFEVQSTASSDISESLREQILGKAYIRRKIKKCPTPPITASAPPAEILSYQTAYSSFEIIPNKTSSPYEIIPNQTSSPYEIVPNKSASSYEIIPSKDNESSFEIVEAEEARRAGENPSERDANSRRVSHKGSGPSRNSSRQIITSAKENSVSELSMKKSEEKNYSTIQTQTVGIQTVSTCTDCNCSWEKCTCTKYPPKCPHCTTSKGMGLPDETSESTFANLTESSAPSSHHCMCNCKPDWYDYETLSTTDHFSDNSDDSYTTDFFDLPYQNNEEYLKLLRELEKKLIARNRERVRKTMQEFERRSRQNKNLDKPICDYSDDGASLILNKFTAGKGRKKSPVCCKCGRSKRRGKPDPVNSDILQNEKRWDEMNYGPSTAKHEPHSTQTTSARMERSMHKSHWQLDPRSGEWVKVSCFQQTDYSRHPSPPHGDFIKDDYKKAPPIPPPPGNIKRECCCRQKKRR